MNEFIKKLIERLEEFKKEAYDKWDGGASFGAYAMSIEIVNQLATEYLPEINVGNDIQTIDVSELLGEQVNDGWIACSERLPTEKDRAIIICESDGNVMTGRYSEFSERWYKGDMLGVGGKDVIAWQPLPAPYQPKGE